MCFLNAPSHAFSRLIFYLKAIIMNINTNYLIRGLSAVYSQLEVSKKNTLVLLKNLLIAKNTGEKQTKYSKNNELNNNDFLKRNSPIMMIENHLSGISSQDRLANNTLKMIRYHPPLSEPHHDLAQLLAQPLREFQSSPTEAYNKWIVSPATPSPGSKISPPRLRPAPPPPTQVQKQLTAASNTLAKRNAANAEQQVANAPAPQQKQSHLPLSRALSQPITTYKSASLMNELSAVLAKRNAASAEQQAANAPAPQQKQSHAPLSRAQSQPITTYKSASLMNELSVVLAKRNAVNTNGNQSKHPSPLTLLETRGTPVYVKEFNEIF